MQDYQRMIRKAASMATPALLQLVGREPRKGIVFHHIPKCGGVSISSALKAAYAPWKVKTVSASGTVDAVGLLDGGPAPEAGSYRWPEIHRLRTQLLAMYLAQGARCVTGHVRFSPDIHERFAASHCFVTVMREPVARFVSQFVYSTRSSNSYDRRELMWREEDLARVGPDWGRVQAAFLAGTVADEGIGDRELVAAAKQALDRLDVVGFLDGLDAFADDVRRATGASLSFAMENRSPSGETARLNEDPLIERVRDYCAPDLEVYAHARRLFGRDTTTTPPRAS